MNLKNAHKVLSPSKINLYLEITGKRKDGFHEIYSLFYPVNWCDEIYFTEIDSDNIVFKSSNSDLQEEPSNTVLKAVNLIQPFASNRRGFQIYLNKLIPYGAGLGSASSNAVSTLVTLNRLWECNLNKEELKNLSLQIGSDCPFFFENTPCIVKGRGEKIFPLKTRLTLYVLVLKKKSLKVSTVFAYQKVAEKRAYSNNLERQKSLVAELQMPKSEKLFDLLFNSFQEVLEEEMPNLREVRCILESLGAVKVILSGSGSSYVGLFQDEEKLTEVYEYLISENFEKDFDFHKCIL